MAISRIGGTASDNWELISSVTPTGATAAVNFTGLGVYRKLLIRWQGIVLGTAGTISVRLNNDSGSSYDYVRLSSTTALAMGAESNATAFGFDSLNHLNWLGALEVVNADTTNLKIVDEGFANGTGGGTDIRYLIEYGIYRASALVSQVNLITSTTFTAVGTVALYGVK